MLRRTFAVFFIFLLSITVSADSDDIEIRIERPDLFGYLMGKESGQVEETKLIGRSYANYLLNGINQLKSIRQELKQCGNCTKKHQFIQKIEKIEAALKAEASKPCTSFGVIKDAGGRQIHPRKMIDEFENACSAYEQYTNSRISEDQEVSDLKKFKLSLDNGDLSAYSRMGDSYSKSGHRFLTEEEKLDKACPYYLEGAKANDHRSIMSFAQLCLIRSKNTVDRDLGLQRLTECANQDNTLCLSLLASLYDSDSQKEDSLNTLADDHEALRIYQRILELQKQEAIKKNIHITESSFANARYDVERLEAKINGLPPPKTPQEIANEKALAPLLEFHEKKKARLLQLQKEKAAALQEKKENASKMNNEASGNTKTQKKVSGQEEAMTEHKKQSLERQCAFLKKRLDRIPPGDNGPSAYAMRTADKYQKLCSELP